MACFEIRYKLLAGRCRTYSEHRCRGEDSFTREVTREERRRYGAGGQEENHDKCFSSAFQNVMLAPRTYLK